jgi:hypothetical protein
LGIKGYEKKEKLEKEGVMKEKSKGVKESKKAPQLSLKEKRKLKKEKKNR